MTLKRRTVSDDVTGVLLRCTFDDNVMRLPDEQLPRPLYVAVAKVAKLCGGKWVGGKVKGIVFSEDAAALIGDVIASGEIEIPFDYGFFPTPVHLAKTMVQHLDLEAEHHVLEPSAGTGRLADAVLAWGCSSLHCVEAQRHLAKDLEHRLEDRKVADTYVSVACFDFLQTAYGDKAFDRIIMNPPFGRQADIQHVTHALKCLKPGGVLVSILAAGAKFRTDRRTVEFRELLDEQTRREWSDLPEGTFKESGTMVNTMLLKVVKA